MVQFGSHELILASVGCQTDGILSYNFSPVWFSLSKIVFHLLCSLPCGSFPLAPVTIENSEL